MNRTSRRESQFLHYYNDKLKKHHPTSAEAVGWSEYLQQRLFDIQAQLIEERDHHSILDVGSGLGHFAGYLAAEGYCTYDYTGIDIVPEMTEKAVHLYPDHLFLTGDFLRYRFFRTYDYTFCSGALNLMPENHYTSPWDYVSTFIAKLYHLSDRGCSFNLLSTSGKKFFPGGNSFFYADPVTVENLCRRISKNITLISDDADFTFTVFMKKDTV